MAQGATGTLVKNKEVKRAAWYDPYALPRPMTIYEKRKIQDLLSYHQQVIERTDQLSILEEIIHQLKHPLIFAYLLSTLLINYLFGSKSFKLHLD